jgi:excisionase family DNA binding protein
MGKGKYPHATATQLLTIADVAELLQCDKYTIRRMISRGDLRAYRFPGSRLIRIDPADLDRIRKPVTRINEVLGGGAQ